MAGSRRYLDEEIDRLFGALKRKDVRAASESLERVDAFRDDVDRSLDAIRKDLLALLRADGKIMARAQHQVTIIAAALTLFAAALGVVFSILVSNGVIVPVRRLLDGARRRSGTT